MREKVLEREREKTRVNVRIAGTGTREEVEKGTAQTDASDWNEVGRQRIEQRRFRTDVARNYQVFEKEKRRVSYFFTNFPENFMAKHMLKAFLLYGDIEEVVIPAKRDRRGKRFGFARAVGIEDPERFAVILDTAVILDNIIIGSEKILVNLPRFDRNGKDQIGNQFEKDGRRIDEKLKGGDGRSTVTVKKNEGSSKVDGVSYAQVLKKQVGDINPNIHIPQKPLNVNNHEPHPPKNQKPVPSIALNHPPTNLNQQGIKTSPHNIPNMASPSSTQIYPKNNLNYKQQLQKNRNGYVPPPRPKRPWAHRTYEIEAEQIQKFDKACVGVVKRPGLSYRMHEEFAQEGYFNVKTTPMGANLVLLESLEEGEIEALITDAREWLDNWFDDIRKWSPKEVDDEPLTWLKVYGVPLHA